MQNLIAPGNAQRIAVAVSGGADSMALTHMLAQTGIELHALTVDHGMRPESAIEAAQVATWLAPFATVTHTILRWEGDKPGTRRMESARDARYALMADYCRMQGIGYLALAHHHDDQAETFLMRLTHGSGVDGLASMRVQQAYDDALTLWRPLLASASHDDLVQYCRRNGMAWVEDPSNASPKYARNRMRKARDVLDAEGLSSKRLAATARRLERASDALRVLSVRLLENSCLEKNDTGYVLNLNLLKSEPFELAVRVMRDVIARTGSAGDYGARFEKVEATTEALLGATQPMGLTLDGCILRANPDRGTLAVTPEKATKTLPQTAKGL